MRNKYFDYLEKYSPLLDGFSIQNNVIEEIDFLRGEINNHPHIVGASVRRYAEFIVKSLLNNKSYPRFNLSDSLKILKRDKIISKDLYENLDEARIYGNKSVHNQYLEVGLAEKSLIILEKIFRLYIYEFHDKQIQTSPKIKDEIFHVKYMPFGRKLIYIQGVNNDDGMLQRYEGLNKIGDASIPNEIEVDFTPNSNYLRKHAKNRVSQYMTTAGLPFKVHWAQLAVDKNKEVFRDHKVHEVLNRSGYYPKNMGGKSREWYEITVETAKDAITAVKEGRDSLNTYKVSKIEDKIELRPEQKEAIKQTQKIFKKKNNMLWNAKMRFGKTLTALQLIKENRFSKVLILTHRPIVSDGWFKDFLKIFNDNTYIYGSKENGAKINTLVTTDKPFIYFASIQDLRGSEWAGGTQGDKNLEFKKIEWDLIIIDEAHEGNETPLANNVKNTLKNENTKFLELSGTPFNLLDKYDEDNIFTWDYNMEQEAKLNWDKKNPDKPNPYANLPKVSMLTYNIPKKFNFFDETKAFNFKEFFKVDPNNLNKFVYEKEVKSFLDYITTPDKTSNFPYSTSQFRESLRHTLWLLPGVKEANCLEQLLESHEIFKDYKIVNVVKDGDKKYASHSDIEKVRTAIGEDPSKTKTITLTVRKLTTGVNIPEWTGVVFLSNTESPTSYLQAAFRAQTPFNHASLGIKENCYIFDFAPDRALKIISESVGLTSKKGKINSSEQEKKVEKMLNFLPILGQSSNGMKNYSVDKMLTQLKKAYAEKAVRSGFEDTSLYNDNLLNLDENMLLKFEKLKGIVGESKVNKKDLVQVNKNGFDKEKYDRAVESEKRTKDQRTAEEIELVKELKQRRKQRNAMISILRGVSIRIPLMIYGMDIDINEDVTLEKFIKLVDDKSWHEFMPEGLSKDMFQEFEHYYDSQVFLEAGRIIRNKAKSFDSLDFLERTEKIGELFGSFKNPDKETILTPWRVVNMGLVQTIGGLSYYDEHFENTTKEGSSICHWVDTRISDEIYSNNNKFIDINSKTGLYPLFIATGMYYKKMWEINEREAGRFIPHEIWREVLENNIYAIAKTPMSKTITHRTLAGYKNYKTNIVFIDNLVKIMEDPSIKGNEIIEESFGNMKFNIVIGNPPYQEITAKKDTKNGQKSRRNIFHYFQNEALNLAQDYSVLIYPGSRWMHYSGKGLKQFGIELMNNPRLENIIFYPDASEVFPKVGIDDGITIVSINQNKNSDEFGYEYVKDNERQKMTIKHPGEDLIPLNPTDKQIVDKIESFVRKNKIKYLFDAIHPRSLFSIESDFVEKNPDKVKRYDGENYDKSKYIKLFTNNISGSAGRTMWFLVDENLIKTNKDLIKKWQVVVSSAHPGGQMNRDNQIEIIDNNSAFGRSRLALRSFNTKSEAENFMKYVQSRAIKYTFLMTKEALSSLGKRVPDIIEYSNNSIIDFSIDIDEQLFQHWGLTQNEINHIKNTVTNGE